MKSHWIPDHLGVESAEGSPVCNEQSDEGGRKASSPIDAARRVRDGIGAGIYDQPSDQLLLDIHQACESATQSLEGDEPDPRLSSLIISELEACASTTYTCTQQCFMHSFGTLRRA